MQARTFVVTVSEAPDRVVVEDVRSRERSVGTELADVGQQIASLLEAVSNADDERSTGPPRPVSET